MNGILVSTEDVHTRIDCGYSKELKVHLVLGPYTSGQLSSYTNTILCTQTSWIYKYIGILDTDIPLSFQLKLYAQYNSLDYVLVSDENAYAAKAVPVLESTLSMSNP